MASGEAIFLMDLAGTIPATIIRKPVGKRGFAGLRLVATLLLLCLPYLVLLNRACAGAACVVLDPGHGGIDPGAVTVDGVYEKTINMKLAREVRRLLEVRGIEVCLMRSTDGTSPSLVERTIMANKMGADLFVSLHANSDIHPSCEGIELYYYPGSCQGEAVTVIMKQVIDDKGTLAPCRVKDSAYLVLARTAMPAVLVEAGYLSNTAEKKRLLDPSYRRELAQALAEGITVYLQRAVNYR